MCQEIRDKEREREGTGSSPYIEQERYGDRQNKTGSSPYRNKEIRRRKGFRCSDSKNGIQILKKRPALLASTAKKSRFS